MRPSWLGMRTLRGKVRAWALAWGITALTVPITSRPGRAVKLTRASTPRSSSLK